jgi:hypothetical protein
VAATQSAALEPRAAPPTPGEVEVVLSTTPTGAEIWNNGRRLGTTPYRGQLARTAAPLTVVFRHRGYRDATRQLVPDRDREIEAVMVPLPARTRLKPPKAGIPREPSPAGPPAPARTPARKSSDLRNPFE